MEKIIFIILLISSLNLQIKTANIENQFNDNKNYSGILNKTVISSEIFNSTQQQAEKKNIFTNASGLTIDYNYLNFQEQTKLINRFKRHEPLQNDWFIMFYFHTCPHCIKFAPTWEVCETNINKNKKYLLKNFIEFSSKLKGQ